MWINEFILSMLILPAVVFMVMAFIHRAWFHGVLGIGMLFLIFIAFYGLRSTLGPVLSLNLVRTGGLAVGIIAAIVLWTFLKRNAPSRTPPAADAIM